mmetsp:Transcript_33066/g.72238  ORF Transcript_33066/g.72238 Transcript_33066/m.72238 type:complete len:201 (+) Transcript_33066:171-773(+)
MTTPAATKTGTAVARAEAKGGTTTTTGALPPAGTTAIAGTRGMIDGISRIAATAIPTAAGTTAMRTTATAARPPAAMTIGGMTAAVTAAVAVTTIATAAAAVAAATAGAEGTVTRSPGVATYLPSRPWMKTTRLPSGTRSSPTPVVGMPDSAALMPVAPLRVLAGTWGKSSTTLLWRGRTAMVGVRSCRARRRRCSPKAR